MAGDRVSVNGVVRTTLNGANGGRQSGGNKPRPSAGNGVDGRMSRKSMVVPGGLDGGPIVVIEPESNSEVLRRKMKTMVTSSGFDFFMVFLVIVYTICIFIQLIVTDPELDDVIDEENVMPYLMALDTFLLVTFVFEICAKVYVYGKEYFQNGSLYVIDAFAVTFCILLAVMEALADILSIDEDVLRFSSLRAVARLPRLVLMFKRVGSPDILQFQNQGLGFTSPVERVLATLSEQKDNRELSRTLRRDIVKVIQIVASKRLYEPVMDAAKEGHEDATAWINTATSAHNQTHTQRRGAMNDVDGNVRTSLSETEMVKARRTHRQETKKETLKKKLDGEGDDEDASAIAKDLVVEGVQIASWMPTLPTTHELGLILENPARLDFDVWELNALSNDNALCAVTLELMDHFSCFDDQFMERTRLENFVCVVQQSYEMTNKIKNRKDPLSSGLTEDPFWRQGMPQFIAEDREPNPYHNAVHAADVVQTAAFMLYTAELQEVASLTELDCFAVLMACVVHDYGHPGVNNMFCAKTKHPIALRYNDTAVLEMHHVASAFRVMHSDDQFNWLIDAPENMYTRVREIMLACVLATDMSSHFAELNHFKSRIQAGDFLKYQENTNLPSKEDGLLACSIVMHACDISNPAKGLKHYLEWTSRVLWEFFAQGDLEKQNNLAVSMFMDRSTTNISKCQLGFIDILVFPLFDAIVLMLPQVAVCVDNLNSNKAFFATKIEMMEEELQSGRQRVPAMDGGFLKVIPPEEGQRHFLVKHDEM
jgi:hypothetical protein